MIPYSRDPNQTIPSSAVKIIGLGGAGANMLERIALDGMEGAELLALNTDIRTLGASLAKEKIQLGTNLTKGLGTGGDPDLGHQAVLEAEDQVRAAMKGRRIVFLCTGLGGGTGSGAAPIVTRIAREEGAFVVVFATMPFAFEGKRRRDQAETSLNELAVLSNALVTFDNNRMGELVLAKQGIHEAFVAADQMISESIKAVIRLVIRPGLINVGLDDLMSALRTNRSRCLFGSGIAEGKDRAAKALRNALASPLLDQGTLLKEAQTVLVHLCGGEDLTLFEIELLMQRLGKLVPENAHVLFGAAVDPSMGESLSLTLISALPEDSLAMAPRDSLSHSSPESPLLDPSQGFTPAKPAPPEAKPLPKPEAKPEPPAQPQNPASRKPLFFEEEPAPASPKKPEETSRPATAVSAAIGAAAAAADDERPFAEPALPPREKFPVTPELEFDVFEAADPDPEPEAIDEPAPVEEKSPSVTITEFVSKESDETADAPADETAASAGESYVEAEPDPEPIEETESPEESEIESAGFSPIPRKRPTGALPWSTSSGPKQPALAPEPDEIEKPAPEPAPEPEVPKLKLGIKATTPQSELSLDSTPRGRFEGENPNVVDGEDLDLPPFLRKKK